MPKPLITEAFLKDVERIAQASNDHNTLALVQEIRQQRTNINTLLTELTQLRNQQ